MKLLRQFEVTSSGHNEKRTCRPTIADDIIAEINCIRTIEEWTSSKAQVTSVWKSVKE